MPGAEALSGAEATKGARWHALLVIDRSALPLVWTWTNVMTADNEELAERLT